MFDEDIDLPIGSKFLENVEMDWFLVNEEIAKADFYLYGNEYEIWAEYEQVDADHLKFHIIKVKLKHADTH